MTASNTSSLPTLTYFDIRGRGLYGQDESERIRCDIVEETFVDAQNALGGFLWNPRFSELRDGFEREKLPQLLTPLQRLLAQNEQGRDMPSRHAPCARAADQLQVAPGAAAELSVAWGCRWTRWS